MSKRKEQLRFLSQSILLEESGLPGLNIALILLVTLSVVGFLVWANIFQVDETLSLTGKIIQDPVSQKNGGFEMTAMIPATDLYKVREGSRAMLAIGGITKKNPIPVTVINVDPTSVVSDGPQGMISVKLAADDAKKLESIKPYILTETKTTVTVVTGSKTLFESLMGPVLNIKDH